MLLSEIEKLFFTTGDIINNVYSQFEGKPGDFCFGGINGNKKLIKRKLFENGDYSANLFLFGNRITSGTGTFAPRSII